MNDLKQDGPCISWVKNPFQVVVHYVHSLVLDRVPSGGDLHLISWQAATRRDARQTSSDFRVPVFAYPGSVSATVQFKSAGLDMATEDTA